MYIIHFQMIPEENNTDCILRSEAMKKKENFEIRNSRNTCNKDTTGLVTINTFSRGHLFFVSSGGIIRYYSPLYRSEGTAQVSIHTIKFLGLYFREHKNIDNVFLFYDNMCNLERLKLWDVDKSTLSPNANLGLSVFNAINKGVDALHIKGGYKKILYFLSEPLLPLTILFLQ